MMTAESGGRTVPNSMQPRFEFEICPQKHRGTRVYTAVHSTS